VFLFARSVQTVVFFGNINDRWLPFTTNNGSDCPPDWQNTTAGLANCVGGAAKAKTAVDTIDAMPGHDHVVVVTAGTYASGADFQRVTNGGYAARYMNDVGFDVVGTSVGTGPLFCCHHTALFSTHIDPCARTVLYCAVLLPPVGSCS
jgi:hypothetical protein